MMELIGKIQGPPGTPYEGGEFLVDIKVPQKCVDVYYKGVISHLMK